MAKEIELRRHTDNDGDALTDEGVQAALEIGANLRGRYELLVSSGAQRATQTLACFACALGERVPRGAVVETGMRSEVEDRWRQAYQDAGSGELGAIRSAVPSWSKRSRRHSGPPSTGFSTAWRMAAGPWSWDTAPRTRRRCWASPASSLSRWRRAPESSWSSTDRTCGSGRWTSTQWAAVAAAAEEFPPAGSPG
jgi:hypothetical protein